MNLGKRLKRARTLRKKTQEQVAVASGASQAEISALESRDSKTSERLFSLADALDVSPRWLLTGEEPSGLDGPAVKRDKTLDEIAALLPGMKEKSREQLLQYARLMHNDDKEPASKPGEKTHGSHR